MEEVNNQAVLQPLNGESRPSNDVLENIRARLQALGIDAPKFELDAPGANLKLKGLQSKLRYMSLYEKSREQPKQIRLKRFLCYGDETPLYQPGNRLNADRLSKYKALIIDEYLNEIEQEKKSGLESGSCSKKLPEVDSLPMFKAIEDVLKNDSRPFRECAIFVIAECTRFEAKVAPEDHIKSLAFSLAKKYFKSENDLFLFVKLANRDETETTSSVVSNGASGEENEPAVKRRKKGGWGKGMKRFVSDWYHNQDPVKLARSIAHKHGLYGWSHADLIKVCHIKADETRAAPVSPLAAVFCYALFGLERTVKDFGSDKHCEQVLEEFKKRKSELEASPETLLNLVKSHKLKVDEVASEKFDLAIWKALVKNMTAREFLVCVPRIWKLDLAGDNGIWQEAAKILVKEGAGSQVNPSRVYITKYNYLKALANKNYTFDSAEWLSKKVGLTIPLREPCPVILEAFGKLMDASVKAIQPNGVRLLMTVDVRDFNEPEFSHFPRRCATTHSLSPLQATALIALCLSRHHKRFTLTALAEGAEGEIQIISVPKSATVESLIEKFKEVKPNRDPTLGAPIIWATERKRDLDAFVLVTPSLKGWKWSVPMASPFAALNCYKDGMKKPDARFALCALENMFFDVAKPPRTEHMMDFAGFDANTINVLNAFVSGELTS